MIRQKVVTAVVQEGFFIRPTGSRVTKSGWKDTSDWDYVVLDTEDKLISHLSTLDEFRNMAFHPDGSGNTKSNFESYRIAEVNLIIVKDKPTFEKYMVATELIKALDCQTKEERVKYFDIIFSGKEVPF